MDCYGMELILDLHGCEVKRFRAGGLQRFCEDLCEKIEMQVEKFEVWASEPGDEKDPKTWGISAVQFILTSNITIHVLPLLNGGTVYLNIFSCKEFSADVATEFCLERFGGVLKGCHCINRR